MEKGLLLYPRGDPGGNRLLEYDLAYDPENEEAALSIRTASTQLENLKKIPPSDKPLQRGASGATSVDVQFGQRFAPRNADSTAVNPSSREARAPSAFFIVFIP